MEDKILLIANSERNIGGIVVQVNLLMQKLRSENKRVSLLNTKGLFFYRLFLPVKLFMYGKNVSIFHIHGCSKLGFFPIVLGTLMGRVMRKKVIVTYHGGGADEFFKKYSSFIRFIFSKVDEIIVLSRYLESIFLKYGFKTHVIPNILDIKESHFVERQLLKPRLITTRTLNPVYSIETAICAFELVQKRYPEASLIIVGSGTNEDKLKMLVQQKALKNVLFTGAVKNEEIYNYLKEADFWCNPTTKDNMPVSLIEAINAGLAIVSTNVGGIPYMVEDKKSAWLVEKADFQEMSNGVIYLLENQEMAKKLIHNAKLSLYQYEWKYIKNKLIEVYES